ncbi:hypothetical protein QOT17_020444 [Balamuthia mandrillaris]
MEELVLSGATQVTEEGLLSSLADANCHRLQCLDLSGCYNVSASGLIRLFDMLPPTLCSLRLGRCFRLTEGALQRLTFSPCHVSLRVLDLTRCSVLTDESLISITNSLHPTLEELSLFACRKLTNCALLEGLVKCKRLCFLSLSRCPLLHDPTGELLKTLLESCPRLEDLFLAHCKRLVPPTGDFLSIGLECVPQLRSLDLSGLAVNHASLLSLFRHLSALETLYLSNVRQTSDDVIATLASNCGASLRCLYLSSCIQLTDVAMLSLALHCQGGKLRVLNIARCALISDLSISSFLQSCGSHLHTIYFSGCPLITHRMLLLLCRYSKKMKSVDLSNCQKATKGTKTLWRIAQMRSLKMLDLSFANLSHVGIFYLSSLYNLHFLCLSNTNVANEHLEMLVAGQPSQSMAWSLEWLVLSNCPGITDAALVIHVLDKLPMLQKLYLSSCPLELRSPDQPRRQQSPWPNLQWLCFSGCSTLTDDIASLFLPRAPHLTSLALSKCYSLSATTFELIARHCCLLQHLDLSHCCIADKQLKGIISSCADYLTTLVISHCEGVSKQTRDDVYSACPLLQQEG